MVPFMPGRKRTETAQTRTEPASFVMSSAEAARALDVDRNQFDSWWDPTRKGWHIPVGDTKVFVPSIGYTAQKRRVPRARLLEIASYGAAS